MNEHPTHAQYRSWLADEGLAFQATLDGDPATEVPSCPGWSMADLAAHVGSYHRWVADLLRDASPHPRAPYDLRPPSTVALPDWYRQCLRYFLDAVDATDPDTSMWSVTTGQRAGDWLRRQAHDLCIHRWDAQNARGTPGPIPSRRATAFIDELFGAALPYIVPFLRRRLPRSSLSIQTVDGLYRRRAAAVDGELLFSTEATPADVGLSGTASDLLLALWRRSDDVTVSGDSTALTSWQTVIDG